TLSTDSLHWEDAFGGEEIKGKLRQFFESGHVPEQIDDRYTDKKGQLVLLRWKFKEMNGPTPNRTCLAIGNRPSEARYKTKTLSSLNREDYPKIEQIREGYRILAGNIPFTNIFLIDQNLNYLVAEGPNFKNWNLDSDSFE